MTAKGKGRAAVVRELEAKFRVHSPFELPEVVGAVPAVATLDDPRQDRLTAVYYDTPDLRLAREGVTLRRRSGGKDAGWHLKLPAARHTVPDGAGARDELQLPDSAELPAQLRDLVSVWVRTAALGPVATLVTERTTLLFRDAEGRPVAELVDDTVTVEDGSHIHARFREIEVEDAGGGAGAVAQVGGLLQDAGAVGGEFVPKVVRALGPRATAPPEPPPPGSLLPRDTAHDVIAATLRRSTRDLMWHDVDVRRDMPEGVHRLRIAARRVRSALRTFAPLLDEQWALALSEEVRWLLGELSTARDAEVLGQRLCRCAAALPPEAHPEAVRAKIEAVFDAQMRAGRARVLETLAGKRYVALVERLVDAAMYPRTLDAARRPAGAALPPLVRASWRKLARRAARAVRAGGSGRPDVVSARGLDEHHRARIAAKQLRYACDAVAPALGEPAVRLAAQAQRVHEILGEHQDALLAARCVAELAQRPRVGNAGFGLGVLYAQQVEGARTARAEFAGLWPEIARPKLRRWLEE